ncbi:MAG: VOC family protein [Thermoleophilaceae bacterium]
MGKRSEYTRGTFSYAELVSPDAEGSKAFYGGVFGWHADDQPLPGGGSYTMFRLDGDTVAGLHQPGEQQPPAWLVYVTVADVDATASRAGELGGAVLAGPFDVMEAGRMAVVADPTGAVFGAWQARGSIGAERVNDPGCLTWCDLASPDPDAARAFYEQLLGWSFEPVDTGGGPPYTLIAGAGGINQAGMRPTQEGEPANWMPYFTVESTDDTIARVGEPLFGPMDVPNGGRIAAMRDPQGAVFAVSDGEVDD